jgi:hypothetical protein
LEPRAKEDLKDEPFLGIAGLEKAGQFLTFVNLDTFVDGARPIAFVKLDVRASTAHGLKHHDHTLVDRLLIEILVRPAANNFIASERPS